MKTKYIAFAFLLLLSVCSMIAVGQKAGNAEAEKVYSGLVAKAKAGEKVDFKEMRLNFAKTKGYSAFGFESDSTKAAFASIQKKDFKDAVKKAEAAIDEHFIDMDAHVAAAIAYGGLGDTAKADLHKGMYLGLVNSIISSGDGKTPETAYVVISTHEEYIVLRALGLQPTTQSLAHIKEHSYDIQDTIDTQTKATAKIYFNIDIVWKAENEMFSK